MSAGTSRAASSTSSARRATKTRRSPFLASCAACARAARGAAWRARRRTWWAAHLVDGVLPAVPVPQYVLAFPYELSGLAATRPEVLRALPAHLVGGAAPALPARARARQRACPLPRPLPRWVYVETEAKGGTRRFEAAPAPSREELQETLQYVYARVDEVARAPRPLPRGGRLERGAVVQRGRGHDPRGDAAGLPAHDDLARERLCRYLARPAFPLARLGMRRDGLVVYRVKNAGRGRVKQRVMSPVGCLARLAAMVPPPR